MWKVQPGQSHQKIFLQANMKFTKGAPNARPILACIQNVPPLQFIPRTILSGC